MQSHDSNAMRASAAVLGGVGGSGYQNADLCKLPRHSDIQNMTLGINNLFKWPAYEN